MLTAIAQRERALRRMASAEPTVIAQQEHAQTRMASAVPTVTALLEPAPKNRSEMFLTTMSYHHK